MFVTLTARVPCGLCGYQLRIFRFGDARVNKRSTRIETNGLGWVERACPECSTPAGDPVRPTYRLSPEAAAAVHARRLKRWPDLAAETHREERIPA